MDLYDSEVVEAAWVRYQMECITGQQHDLERLERTVHGNSYVFVNAMTGQRYVLDFLASNVSK